MSAADGYVNNSALNGAASRYFKPEIGGFVDGKKGGSEAAFCT